MALETQIGQVLKQKENRSNEVQVNDFIKCAAGV